MKEQAEEHVRDATWPKVPQLRHKTSVELRDWSEGGVDPHHPASLGITYGVTERLLLVSEPD